MLYRHGVLKNMLLRNIIKKYFFITLIIIWIKIRENSLTTTHAVMTIHRQQRHPWLSFTGITIIL